MNRTVSIVIATTNRNKAKEIKSLLAGFPVDIKDLNDFGPIPPVIEDGETFEENAYKKASQTARILGYPSLSDDSGLLVEALGGAPGVLSARYGNDDLDDAGRCQFLLNQLKDVANRKAAFECVISIALPSGAALTYEARCEGEITLTPSGENGFGYDPVFFYPPLQKTFAELTREEKSEVSHRGKALRELRGEIDKVIKWIQIHTPIETRFGCERQTDDRRPDSQK